ncbi:hypothetical protein ECC02_001739 [Trypanosoma cruzi]|uniref:J domain-containing protein n=1 Tax=Trypanosoma cruzi TaxID=5693 RepID=A0A7J6YEK2_TRYCR|nr:hypothetical protein ECC02_001739 [Trypanosoma cruzi]
MTDYYQSLELPRDATQEQIRRNYRHLALRFHPDRAGPEGAERFKEIQSAYEVLSNPQKRKIYDRFGASFVDNPVSEVLILQLGGRSILCIMACIPFLVASLVVIFTAFLVAYVEGRLVARDAHSVNDHSQAYWNYVKVFSPLFIVDIIIGIPTLVVFFVSMCTLRVGVFLWTLIVLSLIVLTVLVPVAKDANDMTSLRGGNNFHSWRRWLAPLYVVGASSTLLGIITRLPTRQKRERLKDSGHDGLWAYVNVFFVVGILKGISVVVFSALIACRVDEVIATNYFVVLALPFYVFGVLTLLDSTLHRIFIHKLRGNSAGSCNIFVISIPFIIAVGLVLASVSMVSMRLNDLDRARHGAAGDVFSLHAALIPVYVLLGSFLFSTLMIFCFMCFFLLTEDGEASNSPHGDAATEGNDEQQGSEAHSGGERGVEGGHDDDGQPSRNDSFFQESRRNRDVRDMPQGAPDTPTGSNGEMFLPQRPRQRLSDID